MKINSRQSGISMIEILVVMVLLLVGILSVIRLFPPGFLINKQTEEQTRAVRLANLEVNRHQTAAANLPDAIVPIIYTGSSFVIDTSSTPEDLTEQPAVASGFDWAYYGSNVNKFRRILGERIRIPLPSPTAAGRGSIYLLSSGPFMDVVWPGPIGRSIFIQGSPLNRQVTPGESGSPLNGINIGGSSYAIDYDNRSVAFRPAPYARQFLITYSYYNPSAAGRADTVVDQVIDVPADDATWHAITLPVAGGSLVQFSETIGRRFAEVAAGTWSQVDPYQFYIQSPTAGSLANVGVIVFNPFGRDFTEFTPSGPQPLTARIDYDVLDWHIIHEDRPMPGSAPYVVNLALKDLKKVGDFEDDQSEYVGLVHGVDKANNVGDILVYNTTTGDIVPPIDPNTNLANYVVNHKEGVVTFADGFGNNNVSGTFRFFYKAHGDWALVIQKACGSYRRRNDPAVSFSEYFLGNGGANGGLTTRMYFPLSEAGKTVAIRELWYVDTGGTKRRVGNESYRINPNRTQFETLNGQPLTWIDLTSKHADAASWDDTSTGQAVTGVQGVSFRARVLWRNGTTASQENNTNVFRTRWRRVDVDTILTRSQF